jgi:hypothetical protein
MRPEDIVELLKEKPFRPFRIYLSDGTVYEIRHAELVKVGRSKAMIYFPKVDEPHAVFERYISVSLLHITRLEPVPPPAEAASA